MFSNVYEALSRLGFNHPLHPVMTHLPMGMAMGAFVFTFSYMILRKPDLLKTVHHCIILALITVIPSAFLGFMDWQHSMKGEWNVLIISKIVLITAFVFILFVIYRYGKRQNKTYVKYLLLNTLLMFNTLGLEYIGGELLY